MERAELTHPQMVAAIEMGRRDSEWRLQRELKEQWTHTHYTTAPIDLSALDGMGNYLGATVPKEHMLHIRIELGIPPSEVFGYPIGVDKKKCVIVRLHLTNLTLREERLRPLRRKCCRETCGALLRAIRELLPLKDLQQMLGRALWETRGCEEWWTGD